MARFGDCAPATLGLEGHGSRFALHPITARRSVQHWQHRLRNELVSKPSRTVRPSPRSQPATLGLEGRRSVSAVFVPGRARGHVQDRRVERPVRELRVAVAETVRRMGRGDVCLLILEGRRKSAIHSQLCAPLVNLTAPRRPVIVDEIEFASVASHQPPKFNGTV